MIIRALSTRSPYSRGGVKFDRALGVGPDGRAMVEIDQATLRRIGEAGLRDLVEDPSIELQFPPEVGRHGDVSLPKPRPPSPANHRAPAAGKGRRAASAKTKAGG